MIDQATGMKNGERYRVENVERAHQFPGFFLDGKYYLCPELLTALGWLEGTRFIYDSLDAKGEPVFPNRAAGTIEGLILTLVDGTSLELCRIEASETIASLDDGKQNLESADATNTYPIKGPLRGKVVVITGASSGIGRAAALAFACKDARLVLAASDEEALFDVLDECTDCGTDAVAITTDVTKSDEVEALAARAAEFGHGRIDIWVNNAGVGAVGNFEDTPLEAHEQVIQTDLIGYLRGAYVALPYFKAQRSGILINTLSLGSWIAQPYAAAYSASKFGLRGLTDALRGELVKFPAIHVCDIYPAVMDTPGFRDGGNYTGHALTPPGPIYDPELVAKAMVACAISPRAHITVGAAARFAHLVSFLIPGLPLLSGRLTRWGLDRSPSSEISSGNLFNPPSGRRSVQGGWRTQKVKKPLFVGAALLGIIAGFAVSRSQRKRR
ncbi:MULTISPECIES: SDR family oxidoreductase [Pseudomonas]|jgi:NAD(P)-dependent dehydrogenase (short-subunit alcohol dehydrogenase family)|uniref:SDR family oxidoreductase n=1 Tax=Pseudomonas TaxID=286 RepID=UPI00257F7438|nr:MULTISPECIES: SDR family oxidoreductase [Pseudomonas]